MKICFPVPQDKGTGSAVFDHFGSAPFFLLVDTKTSGVTTVSNRDQHHSRGSCDPLKALNEQQVDAVIVGGIGAGALSRLSAAGVRVFRAKPGTVQQNLSLFQQRSLQEYGPQGGCGGHGQGGNCSHS